MRDNALALAGLLLLASCYHVAAPYDDAVVMGAVDMPKAAPAS